MRVKKQQLEPDMEQLTGSKLGNEATYFHLACLIYIPSTSCEIPGWMNHKLESNCLENINNLRYANDTTLMAESGEELWSLLMRAKEESESPGLKFNIQNTKMTAFSPITSWQTDGKQWKQWQTLLFGAPKSLQMVTEAMRLKDACSLEEKLWPT